MSKTIAENTRDQYCVSCGENDLDLIFTVEAEVSMKLSNFIARNFDFSEARSVDWYDPAKIARIMLKCRKCGDFWEVDKNIKNI